MAKEFRKDLLPRFSQFVTNMALLVNKFEGRARQLEALELFYKTHFGGWLTWLYCVRQADKAARCSDIKDTFFAVIVSEMFQARYGSFNAHRPSEKYELAAAYADGIVNAAERAQAKTA